MGAARVEVCRGQMGGRLLGADVAARLRACALSLGVAGVIMLVALDGGGYALGSRAPLGIVAWWAAALAVVVGVWPLSRVPRTAFAAAGALAAFGLLTGLSVVWAEGDEHAIVEAGRVAVYLGVFALVTLTIRPGQAARWSDGVAAGIAGIAALAMASRLFPDLGLTTSASDSFQGDIYLSYPLDYWNGLAVLLALGFPVLLRAAVDARGVLWRGAALGMIPLLCGALYLTSSRGGMLAAAVGTVAFVALSASRLRAAVAAGTAVGGAAGVVTVLSAREQLVDGPFDTALAASQGRSGAALIVLVCLAAGTTWATLSAWRLQAPRIGRRARWALTAAAVAIVAAGGLGADPGARLDAFRQAPPDPFAASTDPAADLGTGSHLLSGGGNGRWQFWQAALDEFSSRPGLGRGAGSFESWWAQNGSISYFTRQAHSLYLETLGELGLVGLALLLALLGVVAAAATRRLRNARGAERTATAAIAGLAIAFATAAGIDWMWEMTVVGIVGIGAFALLTGRGEEGLPGPVRDGRRARMAFVGLAAVAVTVLALPWIAERSVQASERAALAGSAVAALDAAEDAERLVPWAASPRLQRALVLEGSGDLPGARAALEEAIDRDPLDWRLWLVAARVERAAGDVTATAAALRRAANLNPRSPIFAGDRR